MFSKSFIFVFALLLGIGQGNARLLKGGTKTPKSVGTKTPKSAKGGDRLLKSGKGSKGGKGTKSTKG